MKKMQTKLLKAAPEDIALAAQLLRRGQVVAMPTETVYGLAANALDPAAVEKIFLAKGRPQDNPLIVHISAWEQLSPLVTEIPPPVQALADVFWPGPLTMVMKKSERIPLQTSAGLDTVAVRYPAHPVARALIEAAALPLAAPSANRSGRPSTTTAQHVLEDLDGKIAAVIDGGSCGVGLESTVVDVTGDKLRLLRPGGVTLEQLRAVVGPVEIDPAVQRMLSGAERPRSPGMKYKHYAPRAPVTAVCGRAWATQDYIARHAREGEGILCFDECTDALRQACPQAIIIPYGRAEDHLAQAQQLFDALRAFDQTAAPAIWAQCPQEDGLGLAVANRLKKAAGFTLVETEGKI